MALTYCMLTPTPTDCSGKDKPVFPSSSVSCTAGKQAKLQTGSLVQSPPAPVKKPLVHPGMGTGTLFLAKRLVLPGRW